VSGSGKTTLAREVLFPLLQAKLNKASERGAAQTEEGGEGNAPDDEGEVTAVSSAAISGFETLGEAVLVDQSPLGRTPRSNPAVYVGAFEPIRELFAGTDAARQQGLNASAFSFNSGQGQCEKCRGAGFEKIEMQFLSDVFVTCPECNGRRYREHILGVKLASGEREWSIGDLLEATIDEVVEFLDQLPDSRSCQRALRTMKLLQDVGLGYLRAGQPINTLSGGESQRLKLVSHLAESTAKGGEKEQGQRKLFIFDEPTTGLHFDDVRVLVEVFQRMVDDGHSLLVIEHNLELIRCADWVIDLGPDAGDQGGRIVGQGTPTQLARIPDSWTGRALAAVPDDAVPA
jgi:excinuclease ABC subunit A